jgi:hypothetical protein
MVLTASRTMMSYAIADRLARAYDHRPLHFHAPSIIDIDHVRNSSGLESRHWRIEGKHQPESSLPFSFPSMKS